MASRTLPCSAPPTSAGASGSAPQWSAMCRPRPSSTTPAPISLRTSVPRTSTSSTTCPAPVPASCGARCSPKGSAFLIHNAVLLEDVHGARDDQDDDQERSRRLDEHGELRPAG